MKQHILVSILFLCCLMDSCYSRASFDKPKKNIQGIVYGIDTSIGDSQTGETNEEIENTVDLMMKENDMTLVSYLYLSNDSILVESRKNDELIAALIRLKDKSLSIVLKYSNDSRLFCSGEFILQIYSQSGKDRIKIINYKNKKVEDYELPYDKEIDYRSVSKLLKRANSLFLLSRSKVYIINLISGNSIFFQSASDFSLDDKQNKIYMIEDYIVKVYSIDDNFLEHIEFNNSDTKELIANKMRLSNIIGVAGDDILFAIQMNDIGSANYYLIYCINHITKEISSIGKIEGLYRDFIFLSKETAFSHVK